MIIKDQTKKELPYIIHKFTDKESTSYYQLSILSSDDEAEFWEFKIPENSSQIEILDAPTVTRLFGLKSEDTRDLKWFSFEGDTKNDEKYEIIDQGKLIVGQQTSKFSELFFNGNLLHDRWILRRLPNIFDNSYLGESKEITLLWKPSRQKSFNSCLDGTVPYNNIKCACAVTDLSSSFAELSTQEGTELTSSFNGEAIIDETSQTFEGTAAAVGTVIDMYGTKYVYTPEFITHLYNEQKSLLESGDETLLNTEHDLFGATIDGKVTGVTLRHEPIKHLYVNGIYNGPITLSEGEIGLSYEVKLRSVWSKEFQAWVPFNAKISKLSVVRRPACKICWINKLKQ